MKIINNVNIVDNLDTYEDSVGAQTSFKSSKIRVEQPSVEYKTLTTSFRPKYYFDGKLLFQEPATKKTLKPIYDSKKLKKLNNNETND